ncbi:MAG: TonB family protein [Muribaculaceae bacterium]|nr:TonB family protein [Muribaculaceae bacterium]
MKNYKFLSVIMVLALCFGAAQSVDAKKKKHHKRAKTEKNQTHKKNRTTELTVVADELVEVVPIKNEVAIECEMECDNVFMSAAHMPEFPGGTPALMNFLSQNIRYPQVAQDNGIQGKVVVQFVVEKNGSVGEIKVAHGVDKDLDKEAVRVCKTLPKFKPGRNSDGDPVRVWYTLPITFKLQGVDGDTYDGPTGDYAKDARQAGEKILEILNRDIKSEDDLEQMEKAMDAVQKIYEDFYREKGDEELKKFNDELNKLEYDPVLGKKIEEAMNKLQEKISKLLNE